MPLDRQPIPIPFAGGVDSKTDPKQISVGKLVNLQNATFQKLKQLKKRNGYQALSSGLVVNIDPASLTTFGRNFIDPINYSVLANEKNATGFFLSTPTTFVAISFATGSQNNSTANVRGVVYDSDANGQPRNLIVSTRTQHGVALNDWNTIPFDAAVTFPAGMYFIGIQSDSLINLKGYPSGRSSHTSDPFSDGAAATWGTDNSVTYIYSVYLTGSTTPGIIQSIVGGAGLSVYEDELLENDGVNLYSYNSSYRQWVTKGQNPSLQVRMTDLLRNNTDFVAQDMALHPSGVGVVTAQGQTSGLGSGYVIFDWMTGNVLKDFTPVYGSYGSTLSSKMKTVVLGKYILIFYTDSFGLSINYHAIDTSLSALIITTNTLIQGTSQAWNTGTTAQSPYWGSANIFDVCVNPSGYAFVVANTGVGNFVFGTLDANLVWTIRQTVTASATNAITVFNCNQGAIAAWSDNLSIYQISFGGAPDFPITATTAMVEYAGNCCQLTGVYDPQSYTSSLFATQAPYLYDSGTSYYAGNYVVSNRIGYSSLQNGNQGHDPATSPSYWQPDGSAFVVRRYVLSNGATLVNQSSYQRSVAVGGKAFIIPGVKNATYVPLAFDTALQSSYFLGLWQASTMAPTIVARWLYGVGGGVSNLPVLPEANFSAPGVVDMAFLTKYSLSVEGNAPGTSTTSILTLRGVNRVTFDFTKAVVELEAGNDLHISGGRLAMYDGNHILEHGFHVYPENLFAIPLPSAGTAHQYQYVACYEWMDNQGNIHRSAPSPAVTIRTATPIGPMVGSDSSAWIVVPTLRITDRNQNPTDVYGTVIPSSVVIMLYRTVDNGSIFYAQVPYDVAIATPGYRSAPDRDVIILVDKTTDAVLQGNPQLYTTGGILENISPNPMGSMVLFSNRIVGIDTTNPLQLQRSQPIIPGSPVEFSDFLSLPINSQGGECTALAVLDEKLIAFKQEKILFLTGQGPDRLGNNDDMGSGQLLPADVGCIEPRSIVTIPAGVMFKSTKGLYLLDRSLSTSYIGADVEAYNSFTITSALLIPDTHAVRFTLSNGVALHFDYLLGQWSVFTNVPAVDAVIFQGLHTYLRSDGTVCQETPGLFADPGNTYIPISVVTGWMNLGALQGFQRVRKMLLLGDWKSAHSIQVQVSSAIDNYDNPLVQTATIAATTGPSQWALSLKNQKCEAIQVAITESGTTPGEGLALSAMLFEAGVKKGTARLPAARSY